MDKVLEQMARFVCEWEDVNPDASLGGDRQNFRWMEAQETLVKPLLKIAKDAGYAVVPVEPTKGMIRAMWDAINCDPLMDVDDMPCPGKALIQAAQEEE